MDGRPFWIRFFLLWRRVLGRVHDCAGALVEGLCLGMLDEEQLAQTTDAYYDGSQYFLEPKVVERGLMEWEELLIRRYFADRRRIVVNGAGTGREVLALRKMGYEVLGYECNPALVEAGNRRFDAGLRLGPRDGWPRVEAVCDGAVLGWGLYQCVHGPSVRQAMLADAREQLEPGSPILISFRRRPRADGRFRRVARIAGVLRRLRGRRPVALGDYIEGTGSYCHAFSEDEFRAELEAAGLELVYLGRLSMESHAVARAPGGGSPVAVQDAGIQAS